MARKRKQNKKQNKQNKPKINLKKAASIANEALEFCRSGDYERGIVLLHKAEQRSANNDQIFFNLAVAYHAVNDFNNAQKYYLKAVKAKSENALKILQRGINELALNKIASAECCINPIYSLDKDNVTSKLAIASINLRKSNRETGGEMMRECYAHDPKMTSAIMELAEFGELNQDDVEQIEANLDNDVIEAKNRKFTYLALAKGYDFLGNFEKAYNAFKEAQDLFATEAQITNYQAVNDLEGHLTAVKNNLTKEFISKFTGLSDAGKDMVFIVGLPKSGLHEASFLLQKSKQAEICGELNWCNEKIYHLLQANSNDFAQALSQVNETMIKNLVVEYQGIIRKRLGNKKIAINCQVTNYVNVWLIKILFPNAKIIYARRDEKDQTLAAYFNNAPGMEYLNDLFYVDKYCKLYAELMNYWQVLFDDSITIFDYDSFLAAPEEIYSELISELGMESAEFEFIRSDKPSLNINEVYIRAIPLNQAYREQLASIQSEAEPKLDFGNFDLADETAVESGLKLNFSNHDDNKKANNSDEGFKLNFD